MTSDTTPETVTGDARSLLEEIRDHAAQLAKASAEYKPRGEALPSGAAGEWVIACIRAAHDVPRLLAAVGKVLERHQRAPNATRCWDLDLRCTDHRLSLLGMYAAGPVRDCPDCTYRARFYCVGCHGEEEWPCPEYRDITKALTGSETADVT